MKRNARSFSIVISIVCIALFIVINFLTSKDFLWFIYPIFAILFYNANNYLRMTNNIQRFSLICTLLIICLIVINNYLLSPNCLWALYAAFPFLWWPIIMYAGEKARSLSFAIISSSIIIAYYIFLNINLSPDYAWSVYTTFALLWWPLNIYFYKKKSKLGFAITGSVLLTIFFITVNYISSPNTIWAVYPIFAVIWWPLSIYYFGSSAIKKKYKKSKISNEF